MAFSQQVSQLFFENEEFVPSYFSLSVVYAAVLGPLLGVVGAVALIVLSDLAPYFEPPAGCSRVGLPAGHTNLADEFEAKHDAGTRDAAQWRVKSIFIYPIKSCRGVELSRSAVVPTGLQHDRQFSFARLLSGSESDGEGATGTPAQEPWRFITQREFRLLSQVRAELWVPDPKRAAFRPDLAYVQTRGALVVSFPWVEPGVRGRLAALSGKIFGTPPRKSFAVPLEPTPEQLRRDYTQERFTIWKETVTATNMGLHVPPELRRYLGCAQPLTLMRVRTHREVFRAAPRKKELGWQPLVGFADAYPIHLMGLSSVHEVDRRQPTGSPRLSCRRFRANIYLEGTPPFEEDEWKRLQIGQFKYHGSCRCVRCTMPNIEPDSATRHRAEPRKTLLATRDVDKGAPGQGCLGMNICPESQTGDVKVGDTVEMLEQGEQFYIPQ